MEASSVFRPVDKTLARMHTGVGGNPVYLWVGRLDQNKDPLTVVRGFLTFWALYPSATLYMIFHTEELRGEIEDLLHKAASSGHPVILVGKQPHREMQYWYSSADFIISGSHYEAYEAVPSVEGDVLRMSAHIDRLSLPFQDGHQ